MGLGGGWGEGEGIAITMLQYAADDDTIHTCTYKTYICM